MWLKGVNDVGKTFTDYEGLIYDGAYSSHIEQIKPKALSDNIISIQEAEKNVKHAIEKMILDENVDGRVYDIQYVGEISGNVELYEFQVMLSNLTEKVEVLITKYDGKIYQLLYNRKVEEKKLKAEECVKIGEDYLKNLGYTDMIHTYYIEQQNMVTINYASTQNDIVMYPDLIKVKVAMDTGEILVVEAKGYIFNHHIRSIAPSKITIETAKSIINKRIKIEYEGVAVILNDAKQEVLTYEFKGKIEEREYILFVNQQTKEEEKLFVIIQTPGGKLTM